jgi:hypothetical protein
MFETLRKGFPSVVNDLVYSRLKKEHRHPFKIANYMISLFLFYPIMSSGIIVFSDNKVRNIWVALK